MNVDIRVADWLRSQGHDAVHLRDEGLHRMPNGEIFKKALSEDRIVLTSDLDFGEIAAALKDTAGKVLLLRLQNSRAANVIRRLNSVLPRVARSCRRCRRHRGGIPASGETFAHRENEPTKIKPLASKKSTNRRRAMARASCAATTCRSDGPGANGHLCSATGAWSGVFDVDGKLWLVEITHAATVSAARWSL